MFDDMHLHLLKSMSNVCFLYRSGFNAGRQMPVFKRVDLIVPRLSLIFYRIQSVDVIVTRRKLINLL